MLSLVIPVYKNEANLPRLQRELEQFAGRFGRDLEVVFVVDGSPDGSLRWLQQRLPAWHLRSQLVELSRNFGSFAAIAAGLRQARGDYMAVVTADLQEPLDLALEFHRRMAAGEADVVFGYRTGRADAAASSFVSDTFWRLYRRFVVRDMPKGGIDVFGCTRTVRDHLAGLQEVNTNLIALLLWLGFRRAFVGYERQPRLEGRSAWTLGRKIRYALDSVFAFTDLPIRALLLLGVLGTVFAVVAGVTVFIGWLTGHVPVLGYTPLMLVITFFGGLTALGLGITGQYLWLTLQNSRGRPNFIVRSAETFDRPRADYAPVAGATSARNSS
ncbi:MAG TPA: glycosyltransferase family 2 protein [Vicinamibacterales bacterium]|nr:glycosyltransferase family 2 protein [Vicinamibacterales bacterium]